MKEWLWRAWSQFWKTIRFVFSINVMVGSVILICTIAVSYSHSYTLFNSSIGYNGLFSHLGVIIVEAMFLLSGYNIMKALKQGRRPGQASIYGFWMGAGFVGWSNVSASIEPEVYAYIYSVAPALVLTTIKGLLLGLAPPTSLLISKQIILEAFEGFREARVETSSGKVVGVENQVAVSTRHPGEEITSTLEVETPAGKVETEVENTSTVAAAPPPSTPAPAKLETQVEKVETTTTGQDEEKVENQIEPREESMETPHTLQEVERKDAPPSSPSSEEEEQVETGGGEKKDSPSTTSREKSRRPSTLETGETSTIVYSPGDDPLEVALKILKEEKRRPGRGRLMKAGMTEHTAKTTAAKVTKHLKTQAG